MPQQKHELSERIIYVQIGRKSAGELLVGELLETDIRRFHDVQDISYTLDQAITVKLEIYLVNANEFKKTFFLKSSFISYSLDYTEYFFNGLGMEEMAGDNVEMT